MSIIKSVVTLSLCLLMTGVVGAAITSSGGTEDFEAISYKDEEEIVDPTTMTGWEIQTDPGAFANGGIFCDTSNGGGTLDTASFTVASGAGSKPVSNVDLKVTQPTAPTVRGQCLEGPAVSGRTVTYEFWFAVTSVPESTYVMIGGVSFDALNNDPKISFWIQSVTKDIRMHVHSDVSAVGLMVKQDVGSGIDDDTDYTLSEWQKAEFEVVTSTSGEGSVVFKLNGVQVGDAVAIRQDSGGDLLTHHFYSLARKSSNTAYYLDDVKVTLDTGVDDWFIMY